MSRRITTLAPDGTPARQLSFEEVRHGVLERAGVEFQLYDRRPVRVVCTAAGCGVVVKVPRTGKVPDKCRACRRKEKYGAHTEAQRYAYLVKMAKIAFWKKLPGWVARKAFIKRYGEAPPLEWLERAGLRKPSDTSDG